MMRSVFLTDWSGVVSNDLLPVYHAAMRILDRYQKPRISYEHFVENLQPSIADCMRFYGIDDTAQILHHLYKDEFAAVRSEGLVAVPFSDSLRALKAIHSMNVPIAVVSSHPSYELLNDAQRYEIGEVIDLFIGDSRDKAHDLLEACCVLNADPRNSVYAGDMSGDIRAGKHAGLITVARIGGYEKEDALRKENPDHIVRSLEEIEYLFIF